MINLTFDVEGAKEQLTQVFRDRITAQGSINNVQNVELKDIAFSELAQPIPNQAQLIAELKGDLATAQANGGNWLNNLQPQLTVIPQAVINHATLWNTVIPEVLEELGKAEPDRQQLQSLFQGLKHSVDQQVSKLSPLLASIQAFRATAATDASNFSEAHAPFQQIEAIDKQNLASAQATLAKIALLLNQYNEEIDGRYDHRRYRPGYRYECHEVRAEVRRPRQDTGPDHWADLYCQRHVRHRRSNIGGQRAPGGSAKAGRVRPGNDLIDDTVGQPPVRIIGARFPC